MSLIYLASPYTHSNPMVKAQRYEAACRAAGKLMKQGLCVFSPIAHSHPIELYFEDGKAEGMEFWLRQDFAILGSCSKMLVLTLDGWAASKGVAAELEFCKAHNIPFGFIAP